MNAVPKPRSQGQRTWTDAQRHEQAQRLHARKIWLKSTGPRTPEGKINSARNARHSDYDQRQSERTEKRHIRAYLRTQKSYSALLKLFLKQEDSLDVTRHNAYIDHLFFLENELIDIERQMFGGYRFSEICGQGNGPDNCNIIPFSQPVT